MVILGSFWSSFWSFWGWFGGSGGSLGRSWGSWTALGGHVGGNLAPRVGFTDFWHPPGRPQGPMLGPSWRHVAAKLGHFAVILGIKWTFLGFRSRAST